MQWVRATRARQLTVAGITLVVLAALFFLFRGESAPPAAPVNVEELPRVDGTLTAVEDDRVVMKPFEPLDGKAEIEFEVREAYKRNFDLAHLRSHSAVGIPTRIYYRRDGDVYVAVYKTDAPANTGGARER
jgi:hypothetical protein